MAKTFRDRVKEFWEWFPTQTSLIQSALAGEDPPGDLAPFVEAVRDKIGGLSWVFGPGETEGGLSFTVTGEGEKPRQLLSKFWLESAVDVPGWNFHGSRQPSETLDAMIQVGDQQVDFDTLRVAVSPDEDNQKADIVVWHPVFEHLDDNNRFQILFLLLDEALGEFGTQNRIGEIKFETLSDAMPLLDLKPHLDALWMEKEWSNLSPLETYAGYQGEPSDEFVRADTISGFTCLPQVVFGYMNNGGPIEEDPVGAAGADLIFVELNKAGAHHHEDPLEYRGKVEDEVSAHLAGGGGYVTGAATGVESAYIDVLIFDGENSIAAIRDAVSKTHEGSFEIRSFVE